MSLGKLLGNFGRTNVLDVGGSLLKGYQGVLATKEELRRNDLIESYQAREEARKETKFAQEQMEYQRKHKLRNFDEIAGQTGLDPRIVKDYREAFLTRGWIREDGMIEQQHLERWPEISQMLEHKGDLHTKLIIDGFTDRIAKAREEMEGMTDPEDISAKQVEIRKWEGARSALIKQSPTILAAAEKARQELAIELTDPRERQKMAESRAREESLKASAVLDRAKAEAAKTGGKIKVSTAASNALTKGIVGVVWNSMLGSMDRSKKFKSGVEDIKEATERMDWLRENDQDTYHYVQAIKSRAVAILAESEEGELGYTDAIMQAKQEIDDKWAEGTREWTAAGGASQYKAPTYSPGEYGTGLAESGGFVNPGGGGGKKVEAMGFGTYNPPPGTTDEFIGKVMEKVKEAKDKGKDAAYIQRSLEKLGWLRVK